MPKYEFESARWLRSQGKAHHLRNDFDTASTFRSVVEEIDTLRATVAKLEAEVGALMEAARPIVVDWVATRPESVDREGYAIILSAEELDALAALVGEGGR